MIIARLGMSTTRPAVTVTAGLTEGHRLRPQVAFGEAASGAVDFISKC